MAFFYALNPAATHVLEPRDSPAGFSVQRAGVFTFLQYPHGGIEDGGIFKTNNASSGSFFKMHVGDLARRLKMFGPEVVPDGVHFQMQFLGDALHTAVWQGIFDVSQFFECDDHDLGIS